MLEGVSQICKQEGGDERRGERKEERSGDKRRGRARAVLGKGSRPRPGRAKERVGREAAAMLRATYFRPISTQRSMGGRSRLSVSCGTGLEYPTGLADAAGWRRRRRKSAGEGGIDQCIGGKRLCCLKRSVFLALWRLRERKQHFVRSETRGRPQAKGQGNGEEREREREERLREEERKESLCTGGTWTRRLAAGGKGGRRGSGDTHPDCVVSCAMETKRKGCMLLAVLPLFLSSRSLCPSGYADVVRAVP